MRFVVVCLLVLGACSRNETAETEPSKTEAAPTTTTAGPEAAKSEGADSAASILEAPSSVELLDPGKPPLKRLRHDFREGSKHTLNLHSKWKMNAAVFPIQSQMVMPELDYQLEALVKTVAEDGTAQFELKVANVAAKPGKEVKPQMVKAIKEAAAAMKGASGRFSIDPRGLVVALDIPAPPGISGARVYEMIDQLDRALRLASLPLPDEPVGSGARWTVTQVVEHRGARIQQKSTYELLRVKGSRVRAKVTFEQTAPKQKFRPPGGGRDLELNEVKFEGDGEGTWELGELAPRSASEKTTTVLNTTKLEPETQFVVISTVLTLKVRGGR